MDLATMRERVALDLGDAGGDLWTEDELDRAIRRALRDYSEACPRQTSAVIELTQAGREVDISELGDVEGVDWVWYPYDEVNLKWPPSMAAFDVWSDGVLTLEVRRTPQPGQLLRIFYWASHSLEGLGGATETTVPAIDEELIALGAAGYAALLKSRVAVGTINVSGYTPLHWATWAQRRLREFKNGVRSAMARRAVEGAGPVGMV